MSNKRLNATITIGGAVAGSLKSAFSSTKSNLGQLGSEMKRLTKQQRLLGESIKTFGRMGKDVDGLRAKYNAVTAQIEKTTKATQRLQAISNAKDANLAHRSELRGQMLDTAVATAAMVIPVKLAIDAENAFADVKKVADFADEMAERSAFNTILKQTRELPVAFQELSAIWSQGAQSGIATSDLELFASSAAKIGTAFGLSSEEAGQAMAELRSGLKMNQVEVNTLMDQINYLGNTGTANEKKILSVVQRIGSLGEVSGVLGRDIAALGSTITGVGVQEEVAATGIKNFLLGLGKGENATKSQIGAWETLGMSYTQVAKGMQEDSKATILSVLKNIQKLEKHERPQVLESLFGRESILAIAPLLTSLEQLEENYDKVTDQAKYAGAVEKEFAARAATTANQMQLTKNSMTELGIRIGEVLLPAINNILKTITPVIGKMADWAAANPKIVKGVLSLGLAMVSMKVGALAAGYAFTFLKGGVLTSLTVVMKAGGVFRALAGALPLLGNALGVIRFAIMGIGRALLLNPIGLVIGGIALAGVLIYKYWQPLKAFFGSFFGALWQGLQPVAQALMTAFGPIVNFLAPVVMPILNQVGGWFQSVVQWIGDLFTPINACSKTVSDFGSAGKVAGDAVAMAFKVMLSPITMVFNLLNSVVSLMGQAANKYHELTKDGGSKLGAAFNIGKSIITGGFESGGYTGNVGKSTPAGVVHGQEFVMPAQATKRIGIKNLEAMKNGASPMANIPSIATTRSGNSHYEDKSTMNISIVQQPGESQDGLVNRIMREIERRKKIKARGSMADGAYAQ